MTLTGPTPPSAGVLVDAQATNHHHSTVIRTAPLLACPWFYYSRVLLASDGIRN